MNKNLKIAYALFFVAAILYSMHGIAGAGSKGGPCNAGLAFLILTPPFLLCVILLSAANGIRLKYGKKESPFILSISALFIWTICFCLSLTDPDMRQLAPFGFFELLCIVTVIIHFRNRDVRFK